MLLIIIVLGFVGGIVADIVQNRVQKPHQVLETDDNGNVETHYDLGTIGSAIIGAVAASLFWLLSQDVSDYFSLGMALFVGIVGKFVIQGLIDRWNLSNAQAILLERIAILEREKDSLVETIDRQQQAIVRLQVEEDVEMDDNLFDDDGDKSQFVN